MPHLNRQPRPLNNLRAWRWAGPGMAAGAGCGRGGEAVGEITGAPTATPATAGVQSLCFWLPRAGVNLKTLDSGSKPGVAIESPRDL